MISLFGISISLVLRDGGFPLAGPRLLKAASPSRERGRNAGSKKRSRECGLLRRAAAPYSIVLGRESEISGKAINSTMMITSQPRNHKTPLKMVSSGTWSPTTLLMT